MTSSPTRAEIFEMLWRQAQIAFGAERVNALRPALEERADHVWRVLSGPVQPEDEP